MTNDRFTQIGIQGSTFGDNADISITQTIHVPQPDRPIPSNVRAGSRNFVEYKGVKKGNETSFLAQLAAGLENNQGVIVCAVEGMGGVGKTELALQYAQQHKDKYTAQYWLPLRDKGLAAALVEFADAAFQAGLEFSQGQDFRGVDLQDSGLAGAFELSGRKRELGSGQRAGFEDVHS